MVESMSDNWQTGDQRTAPRDWEAKRLGSDPPRAMVDLYSESFRQVLAVCGIAPALVTATSGTAARESWRQFLFGTVEPLSRLIESELSEKLEAEIRLDFSELRASDLTGRSRAFQSMVSSGMDPAKAAALSGLVEAEE